MREFSYIRIEDTAAAVQAMATPGRASSRDAMYLAGGTTLLDLAKLDVLRPDRVIDLSSLKPTLGKIEITAKTLRLGGLANMAAAASHPEIKRDYPVIAQSLQLAASGQLRNMASLAGNVLQRTRCPYYRDASVTACNKRAPGSGCAAIGGINRMQAVLGISKDCIASYPGDFAQALIALDAQVEIEGPQGKKTMPFGELHCEPGTTPDVETVLQPGELVTAFLIEKKDWYQRSLYLKVRDRESYEFALASAAVALDLATDGTIREARIALGGMATKPWRAIASEAQLAGQHLDEQLALKVAHTAFAEALTHGNDEGQNGFKPELGRRTLMRALLQAQALTI